MKRFRFELEKLLELREYREKEAEQDLARAMGELAAIERRIRSLAEERTLVAADRFRSGRSVGEMRAAELYILRLDQQKDRLIEAAAKADLAVEAARETFMEASREKKVIEKLKEKRLAEHRKAAAAEELKVMDDISSGSAARRSVGSGELST